MAKTRNKGLAQKEIDSERQKLFDKVRKTSIIRVAQMIKSADLGRDKDNVVSRCAFFLGAGASFQSGIPVAGQMMNFFKEQICYSDCPELTDDEGKDTWINENVLNKGKGSDYSKLFESFSPKRRNRQHYIESLIQGKKPSFGYAVLANLIERRYVNTVLTTNFDDLVYIACTTFSGIRPIIYAYGVLASEMRLSSPHPKVLKLHGDYLYSALKNTTDEINAVDQDPNMTRQVRRTTDDFNLIVMGYSGGDESVMKIFEDFSAENELYWCHLKHEIPSIEVLKLVEKKNGSLVAIDGFDEAMHEIRKVVGFDLNELSKSFEERRNFVFEEMAKFEKKYSTPILQTTIDEAKKQSYEKPNEALNWVELFLTANEAIEAKNYKEAEQSYRKVIEINPNVSVVYNNLGYLLARDFNRRDEAEKLYRQAIKLDPNTTTAYTNLGYLLGFDINRRDEAEKLYRQAIKLDPNDIIAYTNLGYLLGFDINRRDEAEKLFRQAIELNSDNADLYSSLGIFNLKSLRYDEALDMFKKALSINREHLISLIGLANLFKRINDSKNAEEYLNQARKVVDEDNFYDLACINAISGNADAAIENLRKAFENNYIDRIYAKHSISLETIRNDPRFKKIMGEE
jgi:tetratricopeptide (TPR) repeat protein/NAD-dependent SIR2 family protein deacetylase